MYTAGEMGIFYGPRNYSVTLFDTEVLPTSINRSCRELYR